ncbi:MAG: hypothetical protein V7749_14260 [Cocleimonas sp.]
MNKSILDKIGITFKKHRVKKSVNNIYYARYWPDGTLRWLFNINKGTPGFFAFYPVGDLRTKCIVLGIRLLVLCGGIWLFAKKCDDISVVDNSLLDKLLNEFECDCWSLFGGTPGVDRKAVLALYSNGQVNMFVKVPISATSDILIENESKNLEQMAGINLEKYIIPDSKYINRCLILSNLNDKGVKSTSKLDEVHYNALNELYEKTLKVTTLTEYLKLLSLDSLFESIGDISLAHSCIDAYKVQSIVTSAISYIRYLKREFGTHQVTLTYAHMDFTPWNSFVLGDELRVIDFEFFEKEISIGYDLIHFIVQYDIMCDKASLINSRVEVKKSLEALKDKSKALAFDDIDILINLYYLKHVSRYLPIYLNSSNPHYQAINQLEHWYNEFDRYFKTPT